MTHNVIAASFDRRVAAAGSSKDRDFGELWSGAADTRSGRGSGYWRGGFAGRCQLADDLWPLIIEGALQNGDAWLTTVLGSLRDFWRFLDAYEKRVGPVYDLDGINEALGILWLFPPEGASWLPPTASTYASCRSLFQRYTYGGTRRRLVWPAYPDIHTPGLKDVPNQEEARAALTMLKREVYATLARWKSADSMAAQGRNLLDMERCSRMRFGYELTNADMHTTYRAIIAATGNPLAGLAEIRSCMGLEPSDNWPPFWYRSGFSLTELQGGIYPLMDDIQAFSQMFMARSGWNPSTVARLDVGRDDWAMPYGAAENDVWVIESWKERSKDWQQTMCRGRMSTGPLALVQTIKARTAALRCMIERDPTRLNLGTNYESAMRSPWLAAGQKQFAGRVVLLGTDPARPAVYWRSKVTAHNAAAVLANDRIDAENEIIAEEHHRLSKPEPPHFARRTTLIPESMTPSDWRNVFASFVFVQSRYSWILTQWALGHKHLSTTRGYLRTTLWRKFSEQRLLAVQSCLFDGLARGEYDPVVLRAKVEYGRTMDVADHARLAAYRARFGSSQMTQSGYACAQPRHPPSQMDPGNPGDGTMLCRRGDRCCSCPAGYAVDCSAMVKRVVQLKQIRTRTSALVWSESQLATDLLSLEEELKHWPDGDVQKYQEQWDTAYRSGEIILDPWSAMN